MKVKVYSTPICTWCNRLKEFLRDNEIEFEDFNVVEDKKLLRPSEEPVIFGDSNKFKKDTGWEQKIELEKTLKDMLDWWRENV